MVNRPQPVIRLRDYRCAEQQDYPLHHELAQQVECEPIDDGLGVNADPHPEQKGEAENHQQQTAHPNRRQLARPKGNHGRQIGCSCWMSDKVDAENDHEQEADPMTADLIM